MRQLNSKKPYMVGMIPAKLGSKRLSMKNLALINKKPLIYYAVNGALSSGIFDRVVINAEDEIFSGVADRYKVDFYKRPQNLVKAATKTDAVVYDFLKKNECDIVAWVSPIAPFQTAGEIRKIIGYFIKKRLDSLITVKNQQVHCIYKDKPVNYRKDEIFARTQDLKPVQSFVYSLMAWRRKPFMRSFEKKGHALMCGKTGFYNIGKISSVIVKDKEDLMLADCLMRSLLKNKEYRVEYDKIVNKT